MSGLERLGGASRDLSAAASLLGYSDKRERKSADDLVSHPRFCFALISRLCRSTLRKASGFPAAQDKFFEAMPRCCAEAQPPFPSHFGSR